MNGFVAGELPAEGLLQILSPPKDTDADRAPPTVKRSMKSSSLRRAPTQDHSADYKKSIEALPASANIPREISLFHQKQVTEYRALVERFGVRSAGKILA